MSAANLFMRCNLILRILDDKLHLLCGNAIEIMNWEREEGGKKTV